MHQLISVEPTSDFTLKLLYASGEALEVDIRPLIEKGGVFAPLADYALFAKVRVGESGRYVEWPGDVDLCADALWLEGTKNERDQHSTSHR